VTGRLFLLLTSPRVGAGLLSREAWQVLDAADVVFGHEGEPQVEALRDSGVTVTTAPSEAPTTLGRALVGRAAGGEQVVWVVSSDGDPGLTDVVAGEVSRLPSAPDVEVLLGSHDVPGARVLDLVAVMDRLRSPGGCPWDRAQTHTSLVPYLIEEAHEAAEALESGDRDHMVEELGDVLLQVAFHARVAAEATPDRRFDIDDVAGDLVDKLVRRHPHVFGDARAAGSRPDIAAVEAGWEEIKRAEKKRRSPTEGVSRSQPAAAWGAALVRRAGRAGLPTPAPAELSSSSPEELGERLLRVVTAGEQRGWDVEDALREAVRRYAGELDAAAHAEAVVDGGAG
jgi:XTP/dITP diphosphohydrolase